jgi:phosphomethylpyrimidine synthase
MKITEDVRKYAAEQGITETEALESGMQGKKNQFVEQGSELYARASTSFLKSTGRPQSSLISQ